jgi:hypothetical protein
MKNLIPAELIERKILVIRGEKVILDSDLAVLYVVETKRLNEQIRRNKDRFPEDFMFQLTDEEFNCLRSQFATSNNPAGRGGRRHLPYAFTEHGAIMAASVLNTPLAVAVSVQVVRAFVKLREMISTHKDLAKKLEDLEQKYDSQFKMVFDAIRQLMAPSDPKKKRAIGFGRD